MAHVKFLCMQQCKLDISITSFTLMGHLKHFSFNPNNVTFSSTKFFFPMTSPFLRFHILKVVFMKNQAFCNVLPHQPVNTVNSKFPVPTFCVFHDFMHFLGGPGQLPVRTFSRLSPDFTPFLKSRFYSSYWHLKKHRLPIFRVSTPRITLFGLLGSCFI